jgi:hypothetical protein
MKTVFAALAAVAVCALASGASANSLVTNGSFETNAGAGQLGYNTSATGWSLASSPGYAFLFAPGTADTGGANGQYGNLQLWGPGNGSNNSLPSSSPDGGYFLALDGDFQNSAVTQTISGLTVGGRYAVGFDYGFAQQSGFTGDTIQSMTVSLGGDSQTTTAYTLPSEGFSGWMHQTFVFTATSTSETLAFLANGNLPVPPFALLDGVTMSDVPEPATWALMLTGVAGLGGAARFRRRRALATV